ncbi:MAG: YdcF family protein [Filimonas sp.]|nr:YdcF family protein [Filimonas sp.]
MFFILSKILAALFSPLSWIFILLIWRYFSKSPLLKKRLGITAVILLIFFTNNFIITKITVAYQPKQTVFTDSTQYSCGILLGGMAGYDKNDEGFFNANADRFIQTVKLYHQKRIQKILVSGGSGSLVHRKYREAVFLQKELIASGVAPQDIILEDASRNTYENAIFSKKIIDSIHLKPPYVLITSALHIPRSERIFKKAGFTDFVIYPCNYLTVEPKVDIDYLLIPQAEALYKWEKLLKEWVGMVAYKLTGKI